MATTPKKRSKKSKVTRTASRVESVSQLKKRLPRKRKRSPRKRENFARHWSNRHIGTITIWRDLSKRLRNGRSNLLKPSVISIENARLSQERETRNRDFAANHVTAASSKDFFVRMM